VSWLLDNFNLPMAGNIAHRQSVVLVFINSDSGEDYITVDGNEGDRLVIFSVVALVDHLHDTCKGRT